MRLVPDSDQTGRESLQRFPGRLARLREGTKMERDKKKKRLEKGRKRREGETKKRGKVVENDPQFPNCKILRMPLELVSIRH